MVSSASTQTDATGGKFRKTTVTHSDGTKENVLDYAKVQGILVGYVAVFLIVVTIMGPKWGLRSTGRISRSRKPRSRRAEEGGEDDTVVDDDNVHRHRGHEIQQPFTKRHRSNKRSRWLFDDVISTPLSTVRGLIAGTGDASDPLINPYLRGGCDV